MLVSRVTLALFSIAINSLVLPAPSSAQNQNNCTRTKVVEVSCAAIPMIDIIKGRPFLAERVFESSRRNSREVGILARDSDGRIYMEQRILLPEHRSSNRDVNTIMELGDDPGEPVVRIFDCFGGLTASLNPISATATVDQSCADVPKVRQNEEPYSQKLHLFDLKNNSDLVVADLGYKQIEGFRAHGVRLTKLGGADDEVWKGKPVRVLEEWVSDELGVVLVRLDSNVKVRADFRMTLTNIQRKEPDPSLFQIPAHYAVEYFSENDLIHKSQK